MEQFITFIPTEVYILVATLYCLGEFLKKSSALKDNYIIFILLVLGIAGSCVLQGLTPISVMQGIISAALAVFVKNIEKQLTTKKDTENIEK